MERGPRAPKLHLGSSSWGQAASPQSLPQVGSSEAPTSHLAQGSGWAWLRLPKNGSLGLKTSAQLQLQWGRAHGRKELPATQGIL